MNYAVEYALQVLTLIIFFIIKEMVIWFVYDNKNFALIKKKNQIWNNFLLI